MVTTSPAVVRLQIMPQSDCLGSPSPGAVLLGKADISRNGGGEGWGLRRCTGSSICEGVWYGLGLDNAPGVWDLRV